jgi:quercetin dioxygenase-like cupin family protein
MLALTLNGVGRLLTVGEASGGAPRLVGRPGWRMACSLEPGCRTAWGARLAGLPDRSTVQREAEMKIVKKISDIEKVPAASALFTGDVQRQVVFQPGDGQTFNFGIVNFSAHSRNKFHKHTTDQLLLITEGTGVVATDDEEQTVTAGDVVLIPAGENHWHGAPGDTAMSHIAITGKNSQTEQTEA